MPPLSLTYDPPATRCLTCGGPIARWRTKPAHGQIFRYDRCVRCGLVFVNPRPTLASLGWFYENYATIAGLPPAEPFTPAPPIAGPPQKRLIGKMLRIRPGPGRFLDIGSGTGIATAAAHAAGLTTTALEIEPDFVTATRMLPGVEVVPALFENFESPPGSFDYILMSHVLEHVHDPLAFVEKAARMLARGGLLWVLLPSFDSVYRVLLGTRDPYFIPPVHLNHFNPTSLAALCRRVGLDVVESTDYHDVPRDVIAKRLPRAVRPAVEAATAVAASIATVGISLCGAGAFASCAAMKPA